jgi:nicotinate-nucleotide adenylyltransferase
MTSPRARRIGVYGGTFDPIHCGHLHAIEQVQQAYALDTVLFVPTGLSWQKDGVSSSVDRLAMVELALSGHPSFAVSRVDVDRAGPTYTVDTLAELAKQYPQDELFFILGNDAYAGIDSWKDAAHLPELAQLVVMVRADRAEGGVFTAKPRVNLMELAALPISATDIRQRVRDGESIAGLVPEAVERYIHENHLYGASA